MGPRCPVEDGRCSFVRWVRSRCPVLRFVGAASGQNRVGVSARSVTVCISVLVHFQILKLSLWS